MINAEAGQILVDYSKHIARWAKMSEQGGDVKTPRAERARENAWRLLMLFVDFAGHVKESDMYWKLAELAPERGKSPREQRRLYAVAKAEDRGYMKTKHALKELLDELLATEKADPRAAKDAKDRAADAKSRLKVEKAVVPKKAAKGRTTTAAAKSAARKKKA